MGKPKIYYEEKSDFIYYTTVSKNLEEL